VSEKAETNISYAIDIRQLSKKFRRYTLGKNDYTTIKSAILRVLFGGKKSGLRYTHAIRDLTMRVPCGSSMGIIGRNGSGKSTLLKLITGIYKPDHGQVQVNGRISALIELGAGFHPDFTGRENLYLGGIMHGLSRDEIDKRFTEIVSFAELEEVIDDPVRTYSSGMYMRLGFSLAVHTEPELLLIDEVLAVGDAAFTAKCQEKIAELRKEGRTLLLVTHDLSAVERWCDEALWLNDGMVMERGEPRRVIDAYRYFVEKGEESQILEEGKQAEKDTVPEEDLEAEEEEVIRWGSREVEIVAVDLCGPDGQEKRVFNPESSFRVEIDYQMHEEVKEVVFGISINRSDGAVVHGSNTDIEKITVPVSGTKGRLAYVVKRLGLLEGRYSLDVAVHKEDGYPYDYHKGIVDFAVRWPLKQVGVVLPEHHWELGAEDGSGFNKLQAEE